MKASLIPDPPNGCLKKINRKLYIDIFAMIFYYLINIKSPFAALAAAVVKRDAGTGADSGEQAGAAADDIDAGAAVTISVPAGTA